MAQKRKRLTVLAFDFPPNDGGVARLCDEISRGIWLRGRSCLSIVTQKRDGASNVAKDLKLIRVSPVRPMRELAAWLQLRGQARASTVISAIWYPDGLVAMLSGTKNRVILAHGSELMEPNSVWRRLIWVKLRRLVLKNASLVVANSTYTRQMVQAIDPAINCVEIPLAVDHNHFCPGDKLEAKRIFDVEDMIVVTTVARLHEYKGHETVFRALAQLDQADRKRFVYLVAGRGPHRDQLEKYAELIGIADQVHWLGFVPEETLPDLYRASDLFVLCSRETQMDQHVEGFGLVLLEAQACGTPAVATKSGGMPSAVIDGKGGWLIEDEETESLRRIFELVLRRPDIVAQAGLAARDRVLRECTWEHYLEVFVEVLNSNSCPIE